MNLYSRSTRIAAIVALCSLGLVASSTGANATTLRSGEGTSHLSSAVTPTPLGPSGCNGGNFCSYVYGNGGTLCVQMNGTGNLSTYCASNSDSSFNNRVSLGVSLFAGVNEGGAYYFLAASDYLLDESQNQFNQCTGGGTSCGDYNGIIENHLQSVQFQ